MLFARSIAVFFFLLAGCSGSGGFTEGLKLGKKDDKGGEDKSSKKQELGQESESDTDSADQPIQITGTYLTCSEVSANESDASFGCRLARKSNGETVALNSIATQWEFDYEVLNQTAGEVEIRNGNSQSAYQIFYDFQASSRAELKKLVTATRIMLDLDLRPGAGVPKSGPEFAGLISTFIPAGQSEITNATQEPLDNNVVNSTPGDTPTTTTTNNPQTPVKPTEPVTTPDPGPGPQPQNDPPGPKPEEPVIKPDTGGNDEPPPVVTPANIVSAGPVVTFSTVYKAGGAMALTAAFDQDGLTDAKFSGGGDVAATNIKVNSDGSATYRLSAPISVSVKKGSKTCSASGAIITGNMSLPLVCK